MNVEHIRIDFPQASFYAYAHVYREGVLEITVKPEGLIVAFIDDRPNFLVAWDEAIRDALVVPPLDEVKQGASPTLGEGPSSQP